MPLITVIVPVFQVERYLPSCLESICKQTYENLEIILVDDGSHDRCPEICDAWAKKDARIRVIHKENEGVSAARNTGLAVATGKYIAFVDSDDRLRENALQAMLERIQRDGSDLAIAQPAKVDENGIPQKTSYTWMKDWVFSQKEAFTHMQGTESLPCYAWGKLYRRAIWKDLRFPDISCGEDVWVWPTILQRCTCVSVLSEKLYDYVQRSSSIVHTKKDTQILDSIQAALHATDFFLSARMMDNASAYYMSALYQTVELNRKKPGREYLIRKYSWSVRRHLFKPNAHAYIRWIALYVPWSYDLMKWIRNGSADAR